MGGGDQRHRMNVTGRWGKVMYSGKFPYFAKQYPAQTHA